MPATISYPNWREFEAVIKRAEAAFVGNGVDPSHQIVLTHKMMTVGMGRASKLPQFLCSLVLAVIRGDIAILTRGYPHDLDGVANHIWWAFFAFRSFRHLVAHTDR